MYRKLRICDKQHDNTKDYLFYTITRYKYKEITAFS